MTRLFTYANELPLFIKFTFKFIIKLILNNNYCLKKKKNLYVLILRLFNYYDIMFQHSVQYIN